jgi:hypothetical protein
MPLLFPLPLPLPLNRLLIIDYSLLFARGPYPYIIMGPE